MYRHMVIFDLESGIDSEKTKLFLTDGERILTAIAGVKNFTVSRQVSPKNDYTFCFSMDFDSEDEFKRYSADPEHDAFVSERWEKEVTRFMEIDLC